MAPIHCNLGTLARPVLVGGGAVATKCNEAVCQRCLDFEVHYYMVEESNRRKGEYRPAPRTV